MNYEKNVVAAPESTTLEQEKVNPAENALENAANAAIRIDAATDRIDTMKTADAEKTNEDLAKHRSEIQTLAAQEAMKKEGEKIITKTEELMRDIASLENKIKDPEGLKMAKFSLLAVNGLIDRGEKLLAQQKPGSDMANRLGNVIYSLNNSKDHFVNSESKLSFNPLQLLTKPEGIHTSAISDQIKKEYATENKLGFLKKLTLSKEEAYENYLKNLAAENTEIIGGNIDDEKIKSAVSNAKKTDAQLGSYGL